MANFDINLADMNDDASWASSLLGQQKNPSGQNLSTSQALNPNPQVTLTSYSVSDMMSGMATFTPQGVTYDTMNQTLSTELEGLRTEDNKQFPYQENTKLKPYDIFLGNKDTNPTAFGTSSIAAGLNANATGAGPVGADGTPTIMGGSGLSSAQLLTWWNGMGKGQPPRLTKPIGDVISAYISVGNAEGVTGDRAFIQSCWETAYFTNNDTIINNYAGLGHYDNAASGIAFASPEAGIQAQIQLLKEAALGKGTPMALQPNLSPGWGGAQVTTWGGLAGTWASDTTYWTRLNELYNEAAAGG